MIDYQLLGKAEIKIIGTFLNKMHYKAECSICYNCLKSPKILEKKQPCIAKKEKKCNNDLTHTLKSRSVQNSTIV